MDRVDVVDLLTIVQSGDSRTIGEIDIGFWLQMLGAYDKDDCLDAIIAHRSEKPGVWLEPGHVVGRVRATKRDRLDRMDPDERRRFITPGDRDEDRFEKTGLGTTYRRSERVTESGEALTRGKYVDLDPAGWQYGLPGSPGVWDRGDPNEDEDLDCEITARVRVFMEKNPECESQADAEYAIRLKDREKADAIMRKWKRGEMADVLGGAFPAEPTNPDVIDAEVVNLDSDGSPKEELF